MPDFTYGCKVKYNNHGTIAYGFHKGSKAIPHCNLPAPIQLCVWVEDVLTGEYSQVPQAALTMIPTVYPSWDDTTKNWIGGDETECFIRQEFEKAKELSNGIADNLAVGKLFQVHVADGFAWYVITKVGKRSATVEWRGFCPDRWVDQTFGYGGSFPHRALKNQRFFIKWK